MKKIYFILAIILIAAAAIPVEAATWSKYKIMIDPGHGGYDSGASGYGGKPHEASLVLSCGKKLRDRIQNECGGTVKMTRTTDVFVELSTRRNQSVSYDPYIFCSIHLNAYNKSARGTATYYYWSTGNSKTTARKVQDRLVQQFNTVSGFTAQDRGIVYGNFAVIKGSSNVPAILTEGLFVDNKTEWNLVKSTSGDGFKKWVQGHLYGFYDRLKQLDSSITNPTKATATDKTAPTVSRATTAASSSTAFYAYAYATDNVGVSTVKFNVYADANGSSTAVTKAGTAGDWTIDGSKYNWRYKVNISDHSNKKGKYTVKATASDAAGNTASKSTSYTFGTASITCTPDTASLTAVYGAAEAPHVDLTVKATYLETDIRIASSSSGITATTQSGWDTRAGGTLRLTLNTNYTLGPSPEHRVGYVAIESGSGAAITRIEVPFSFLLTSPESTNPDTSEPEVETPGAQVTINDNVTSLNEVWNFSEKSGKTADWITNGAQVTQDMAFKDGKLYVVHRNASNTDNKIYIVNAYTGAKLGELPTTTCTTGTYFISAIENFGGKIVACNLAAAGTSSLDVYIWNDDTSEPTKLLSTVEHNGVRAGDALSVSGDMKDGKIWFGGNNAANADVYYYQVTDGVCATKPTVISLKKADGTEFKSSTAALNITVEDDTTFWVDAKDNVATRFKYDGTFVEALSDVHAYGSDIDLFTVGAKHYMAAMTYLNTSASTGLSDACFTLFNVTDGVKGATPVGPYPAAGLGASRNVSFRNTICHEVNAEDLNIWVLCPFQGAAYYKFSHSGPSATPPTAIEDADVEVTDEAPIYYNIQGMRISKPERGFYIRVQGGKATKVFVP